MIPHKRIIVALDVDTLDKAESLVETLAPYVGCFKIGLELLTSVGAQKIVEFIHSYSGQVFYDGKFNDIPNTMAGVAKAVADLNVKMFNVHASSGIKAMKAAVDNKGTSLVLAVTVLTSLNEDDSLSIFGVGTREKVIHFAHNAKTAGCDGIVCSPKELEMVQQLGSIKNLLKVVPGIRPLWANNGDQKRVMTPGEAIKAGADYLVIGRPITKPPKEIGTPIDAVEKITEEIGSVIL